MVELPAGGAPRRRGVIAVVWREGRFLAIWRSEQVVAPGAVCFPGGGIEADESEAEALVREFREELGAGVEPARCVWRSTTRWGVELAWWSCRLEPNAELTPNPLEVASHAWLTSQEMLAHARLLESNREFLAALAAGQIALD
jgi:8-oxo-dGTP diphosphatase